MIGDGARLMRALKNFTLDLHISDGYNEVNPPLLINENIIYGLGKKGFTTEMYQTLEGQYLSATEEFPITGMYANEVIDNINLPLRLTGGSNS
jgi:seryl-tRNA synthetase